MFASDVDKVIGSAKARADLLEKNPLGYFISSMLAGIFVGIAVVFIFTIGGIMTGAQSPVTRILMGISFGVALSLVIMAGTELFTGNNFIMATASFSGEVSWGATTKVWVVSFIGNLLGSILTGYGYFLTKLATVDVSDFIVTTSAGKMGIPLLPLFVRAIFCNMLVCVAIWCAFRLQNEAAKLIIIFWCLYTFITTGYEHSIANMTLFTVGLLYGMSDTVNIGGYIYNIAVVTLGNMVGGIFFIALPYVLISREKKVQK